MDGLAGILALGFSGMVSITIVVILFGMVQARWHGMRRAQSESSLAAAEALEKQGQFKQACWKYALSLYHSPTPIPKAQTKAKLLWEKFGPFDFDFPFILEMEKLPPDTNEHMLSALYEGVTKEMGKLVAVPAHDGINPQEDSGR